MRIRSLGGMVGGGVLAVGLVVFALANAIGLPQMGPATGQPQVTATAEARATQAPEVTATAELVEEVVAVGAPPEAAGDPEHEAAAGPEPAEASRAPLVPEVTAPIAPAQEVPGAPKRVGIQAGHWLSPELPDELASLRTSTGTAGGGVAEWQLNRDIAKRVAALLEAEGVTVDVIPATVPPGYKADAFIALHADGDASGTLSGFKLSGARWSTHVDADNALIDAITEQYAAATGFGIDSHISRRMTGYYAFNYRRFQHAVAQTTPAVILEMGFMTNAVDLRTLLGAQDKVAQGIARGVLRYLELGQAQ